VAGAEIAVDVVLGEPRVLQRAAHALRVELRRRDADRLARRMLERAHDIGLALDAHASLFRRMALPKALQAPGSQINPRRRAPHLSQGHGDGAARPWPSAAPPRNGWRRSP